jgi:hypothetical protein
MINGSAEAQGTLQVATKTIEKTVGSSSVRTLHINAEKADIEINTWEKAEIAIVMELSARHTEKSVATTDLSKVKYIADKSGRDFFLRNYIVLKEGENKPASNIKARYIIHLPASCAVNLKNTFGTITLKGLTNNLQLKADFCTTYLSGIAGKGLLETTFGELKGIEISGSFTFSSDHTNLELESIAGAMKLDALYGNIRINPSTNLTSLTIYSKKAEVTLMTKNWQNFDYHINSAYTTVKLPNGFKWKRNTTDFKDAFYSKNQLSQVQINAEFGNLTIR